MLSIIETLLVSAFSIYAGVMVSQAVFRDRNRRKGLVLAGMWLCIYITHLLFIAEVV